MIQIDMKMPEHCVDCPFSLDNCCLVLGKYVSLKQWAKGGIQKWCPLKEQDAVEPIKPLDNDDDFTFLCSNCKGELFCGDILRDNFCPTCGKRIEWEGR